MDQLITGVAHPIVTFHRMLGRIFMEMIVQTVAPFIRMLPFQQREHGNALHVRRHLNAGKIKKRRCIVDILHHLSNVTLGLIPLGKHHDKRRAHGFFIHEPFVKPSVLSHVKALIGSIYNKGIVEQTIIA